jgi:hypothetical protein
MEQNLDNSTLFSNLIAFNQDSLDNMRALAPDIYDAFQNVLDVIKKEYGLEYTPPVAQQPTSTQQPQDDYRFLTAKEIADKFFGGVAKNDIHGIGVDTWERDFANKKLSEVVEDDDDFKRQLNNVKNSTSVNVNPFSIPSRYLVPVGQQTTQPKPKTNADFKVGDKVKIPTSKSYGVGVGSANTIKNAILKKQHYLYVISVDEEEDVIILDEDEKGIGETYSISKDNIELYDGAPSTQTTSTPATPQPKEWTPQDLVGKIIQGVNSGTMYTIDKLIKNNPKNKRYELTNLSTQKTETWDIGFNVVKKLLDGSESAGYKMVAEPTKKLYTLAVETDPAQVEYEIGFVANRGDRNSPSQSAGDLKFVYNNVPDAYNTILNTKFKGNDGQWYKIHVGNTGTWTWRKVK